MQPAEPRDNSKDFTLRGQEEGLGVQTVQRLHLATFVKLQKTLQ
jgi:hypothetical protein